jgi:hypothetical protein
MMLYKILTLFYSRSNVEREKTQIHYEKELTSVNFMAPVKEKSQIAKKVQNLYYDNTSLSKESKLDNIVEESLVSSGEDGAYKTFIDSEKSFAESSPKEKTNSKIRNN